jgi:RimJ/RimL family protein N-acetyltransferase
MALMTGPRTLSDGTLTLCPLTAEDAADVAAACCDEAIWRHTYWPRNATLATVRERIASGQREQGRGRRVEFAVRDAATSALVGFGGLRLDRQDRTGAVFFWTAPAARRRGVATATVRLLCAWAVDELSLARLEARVDVDNVASRRVLARAGFVPEGVLHGYRDRDDGRVDGVLMARVDGRAAPSAHRAPTTLAPLPYFLHINKNGGNTMRSILVDNYGEERVYDILVRWRESDDGSPKTVDSLDANVCSALGEVRAREHELACVALNLPYGLHRHLERPVLYFTLLREPVARGISYWFFAYEHRHEHPLWSRLEEHDLDLERIIATHAVYQFSNDQIRMVTGSANPDPGAEELELAKELIEKRYFLAGTVEAFDATLRTLAERLAWPVTTYEPKMVGRKTERSILPRRAAAILREANEWDARLYDWLVRDYLPRRLG